jgi:hypothetical protein
MASLMTLYDDIYYILFKDYISISSLYNLKKTCNFFRSKVRDFFIKNKIRFYLYRFFWDFKEDFDRKKNDYYHMTFDYDTRNEYSQFILIPYDTIIDMMHKYSRYLYKNNDYYDAYLSYIDRYYRLLRDEKNIDEYYDQKYTIKYYDFSDLENPFSKLPPYKTFTTKYKMTIAFNAGCHLSNTAYDKQKYVVYIYTHHTKKNIYVEKGSTMIFTVNFSTHNKIYRRMPNYKAYKGECDFYIFKIYIISIK